jgi:hypothetical protein
MALAIAFTSARSTCVRTEASGRIGTLRGPVLCSLVALD